MFHVQYSTCGAARPVPSIFDRRAQEVGGTEHRERHKSREPKGRNFMLMNAFISLVVTIVSGYQLSNPKSVQSRMYPSVQFLEVQNLRHNFLQSFSFSALKNQGLKNCPQNGFYADKL
jgi:hypothetical protein